MKFRFFKLSSYLDNCYKDDRMQRDKTIKFWLNIFPLKFNTTDDCWWSTMGGALL